MKNKFLFSMILAGTVASAWASASVKLYNFTDVVCTGSVSDGTSVTLTVTDPSGATKTANGTFSGAYMLKLAEKLTAGRSYEYAVTEGSTKVASGTLVTGNDGAALFGAAAPSTVSGGSWDNAPAVSDSTYVFSGSKSVFTPTAENGGLVRIDSTVTFTGGADELEEIEALGSFTLAQGDGDAYYWAGLAKVGGEVTWVALTGVPAAVGTYETRMEFDFAAQKVRYLVKQGGSYVALKKDAVEWFGIAKAGTAVSSVGYEGTGSLAGFTGSSVETNVAEVGSTKYASFETALAAGSDVTLLTDVTVTPSESLVGSWTLAGGKECLPVPVVGYTVDASATALSISRFSTTVNVAVSGQFGYDFTNGTFTVSFAGSQIQLGDESVTAQMTIKDKDGVQVGAVHELGTIDATTESVNVAIAESLSPEKGYSYEVVVKKDATTVATSTSTFVPGVESAWFSATSDNWANNGAWGDTPPTPVNDKIPLTETEYVFTPVKPDASNDFVQVDTVVEVTGALALEDLPVVRPGEKVQGMITVSETSAEDATATWKAYVNGDWVNLTGASTDAGTYTIRAEFDYSGADKYVRYSVGKDGVFSPLSDGRTTWLANSDSAATTLKSAAALGSGALVALVGKHYDAFVAEVNGVKYKTAAEAIAASENGKYPIVYIHDCTIPGAKSEDISYGGKAIKVVVDEAFKAAHADLMEPGANGLMVIESYVLGLDPEVATSKPVVSTVQNAEADKIRMQIANVRTDSGLPVSFQLQSATSLDSGFSDEGSAQGAPVFAIDFDGKIKYYRINYSFE